MNLNEKKKQSWGYRFYLRMNRSGAVRAAIKKAKLRQKGEMGFCFRRVGFQLLL